MPSPKIRSIGAREFEQPREERQAAFSAITEEVENEEERRRHCPTGRFQREAGFNLFQEQIRPSRRVGLTSLQCLSRQPLGVGQFVEYFPRHPSWSAPSGIQIGSTNATVALGRFNPDPAHNRRTNHIKCLSLPTRE